MANRPAIDNVPRQAYAALWRNRINFLQMFFPNFDVVQQMKY